MKEFVGRLDREQCQSRREQVFLPGMRSNRIAEIGFIVAALEPIGAPLLLVRPADRQLRQAAHLVEDDGPLRDRRPDDDVSLLPKTFDDLAQDRFFDDDRSSQRRDSRDSWHRTQTPSHFLAKASTPTLRTPGFMGRKYPAIASWWPSAARKPPPEFVASTDNRAGVQRRKARAAGWRPGPEP